MTPHEPVLEHYAQQLGTIIDANGTVMTFPMSEERVLLDPITGARAFSTTTLAGVRTADGIIVSPTETWVCQSCKAIISKYVTTQCVSCRTVICTGCSATLGLCTGCTKASFWERLWDWVFDV